MLIWNRSYGCANSLTFPAERRAVIEACGNERGERCGGRGRWDTLWQGAFGLFDESLLEMIWQFPIAGEPGDPALCAAHVALATAPPGDAMDESE